MITSSISFNKPYFSNRIPFQAQVAALTPRRPFSTLLFPTRTKAKIIISTWPLLGMLSLPNPLAKVDNQAVETEEHRSTNHKSQWVTKEPRATQTYSRPATTNPKASKTIWQRPWLQLTTKDLVPEATYRRRISAAFCSSNLDLELCSIRYCSF